MKRGLIALGLTLALGMSAQAKTPKEVLEPYKAYRTALAADEKQDAADFAYEAWQKAEDLMGDSKTTGDLASNFAELRPMYIEDKQAWKLVMKAHKRAIDLSGQYKADPGGVEIDRRAKYLAWLIPNLSMKVPGARDKDYSPERLSARIDELGLKGSTFDAESAAFRAQAAMLEKDWKATQMASVEALKLFDARTDGIPSVYEFAVPIYLARAFAEQDMPVEAALTYQGLMTKLEDRSAGHNNPISGDAYAEWLRLRDEVVASKSDHPRAEEVIDFTVPIGRQAELSPLVRQPPKFPPGFLRGNKSGFVKVVFNIDIDGRVINPKIVSSTKKSLHEPTLKSLKKWRYTPNLPAARSKDIDVTIRFDLTNSRGKRLDYGKEKSRS